MFILDQNKQYLFPPNGRTKLFFDYVAWFFRLVCVYLRYSSDIENITLVFLHRYWEHYFSVPL